MANPIQANSNPEANSKRQKQCYSNHHGHSRSREDAQPLISGLPDHLAEVCLALVRQPALLSSVCHSWRRLIYSPSFPPFLSLYTVLSPTRSLGSDHNRHDSIQFLSYDPISSKWDPLPPLPPTDPPLRLLLRHPSFISRNLPMQSVSASGNLVLLAATADNFFPALSRPLVFNPLSRNWTFGPPLATPRRWCAAGSTHGAVYVASGVGSQFSSDVAKSVEKWELQSQQTNAYNTNQIFLSSSSSRISCKWKWEKMKGLKDVRFCRDAVDAVGWRGKLCMVNVKGHAAKEGIVYDPEKQGWEDMPAGMVAGWRGPVAAMDEEVMYAVDEANGVLSKYDPERDQWECLMDSEKLIGAQQMAAGGGRLCIISGQGIIVVVDVAVPKALRLWEMDAPPGFEAVAVHILPRMSSNSS
uniref:F-box family protein n=1 Tax=Rhizophora mucronata TaxID=61149 RepID=A0A2P2QMS3_RHIMU